MQWKDIWESEPPRNKEILFLTGDGLIHFGEISDMQKLRKCQFHCFMYQFFYDCDGVTDYENRVLYWCPIPEIPQLKRED